MNVPRLLLIPSLMASACLLNACTNGVASSPPPPAVTHFSVSVPTNTTAGVAFQFTVTALTASNEVAASYSGTVHFTSTDPRAALPANSPLTNGSATFSATFMTAGNQSITATDTVTLPITGTSASIAVTSNSSATHFLVSAPANATTGAAFNFSVTALDASNTTVNSYSGTVHFTSTDPRAALPANSPLTNGSATFSATFMTAGNQSITATDTVTLPITGTSASIAVTSNSSATHFLVSAPANATTGAAFNFTVTALDASNITVNSYSGTVHFTSTDSQASLPPNSMLSNGTGSFPVTLKTVGNQTITATDIAKASITGMSNSINVTQGTGLAITSGPLPSGTVGVPYGTLHKVKSFAGPVFNADFFQLMANESGNLTWSLTAAPGSSIPPGLNCCDLQLGTMFPPIHALVVGAIYGVPTKLGTYNVVVSVTNGVTSANATYAILINPPPPPSIDQSPLPAIGTLNSPYVGFTFTAANGLPPLTWGETGALPVGLQLSTDGLLSGKPTEAGSFPVEVLATDSLGQVSAPRNFTIQVLPKGFTPTRDMGAAHQFHTATLLGNGKVLVVGGATTAELFDPASGTFAPTGSLSKGFINHTATVLSDGRVLIAGGFFVNSIATAELYDPTGGTFSATESMATARSGHTATLLGNGKVLVAGGLDTTGIPTATAELFDPATGTFAPTGSMMTARAFQTATLLGNGMVLVAGGEDPTVEPLATAELYDPATGTFSLTGGMTTSRLSHTATMLTNGKVLVTGGLSFGGATAVAELFDPATATFSSVSSMETARSLHTATLLVGGQVLVTGGLDLNQNVLSASELFDPATGAFTPTADMTAVRAAHAATLLNDGTVLVTGGRDPNGTALMTAEIYQR